MFKCNGLQNICDINNIEILVGIEDYVENCYMYYWDEYVNVCIIYDYVS